MQVIGERGVHALWIEAGGRLLRSMLQERLLDRLQLLIAPTFLPNDSVALFETGTEFDLKKTFHEVHWRQIGNIGACTLERRQN